ncbi:MAG TPA: D-alanine--D-alanine ligase family protein [Solirubrobacteraceae bacterium]|nr:D-alanine--D-alanine ligase family protein [Solirubrobacteraceae bacterium]
MTAANGHTRESPLRVAVLAGGRSSEHEVSLSSGRAVREGLLAGGHQVLWVEISREGEWRCDGELLSPTPGHGLLGADVAFPVLHGPFGEDGTVQGMLETLAIPYVGSAVAASAVSLDKILFKELMSASGVPQVDFVGLSVSTGGLGSGPSNAELLERLGLPVFVKPAHLGSSVGIVKVTAPEELDAAIEQGFSHDERVIVEAAAPGREVECAVLGRLPGDGDGDGDGATLASPLGEIVFGGEWYDYEAKYAPGGMQLIVPARIPPAAESRARGLALEVFAAAGCEGLARVDFFVDGERVLVNELNTMPGFTPTSVYAKLVEAAGIPYPQLVERLCRLARERHRRLAGLRH